MRKMTLGTKLVLLCLQGGERYGYQLTEETGIGPGTLYPMLGRLADAGLVKSETRGNPIHDRLPDRRYYALTPAGRRLAATVELPAYIDRTAFGMARALNVNLGSRT
jgi:DNA-binding PadR family transcriptional regulator